MYVDYSSHIEDFFFARGIEGYMIEIRHGPLITTYFFQIEENKLQLRQLESSLAFCLRVANVRMNIVPELGCLAIEISNKERRIVSFTEVLESAEFRDSQAELKIALGQSMSGQNIIADLTEMPHLLIAGATGTGKSVCLNALISSLIQKDSEELKLILVDPKRLELNLYDEIPHLLNPVVVESSEVAHILQWLLSEMDRRYRLLAQARVRNIKQFNSKQQYQDKKLSYIVVVVDEFADLMMTTGKKIESQIVRLAQMARAVGIHMVIATQRPTVNVVTGLIKANFPSRIAFRVTSYVDSRTILDGKGAEELLGKGDMLFMQSGMLEAIRVAGSYIDEKTVEHICGQARQKSGNRSNSIIQKTVNKTEPFRNKSKIELENEMYTMFLSQDATFKDLADIEGSDYEKANRFLKNRARMLGKLR